MSLFRGTSPGKKPLYIIAEDIVIALHQYLKLNPDVKDWKVKTVISD